MFHIGRLMLLFLCLFFLAGAAAGPAAADWPRLSYADAQHGWYVDHDGPSASLSYTATAGDSIQMLPARYTYAAGGGAGVCFPSASTGLWWGFIGTPFGTLVRTTDGGLTWTGVTWPELHFANDVVFADSSHGWAESHNDPYDVRYGGVVARTSDAGATWRTVRTVKGGAPIELAAPSAGRCYVLQRHRSRPAYRLFGTSNGGSTWVRMTLPSPVARVPRDAYLSLAMAFPAARTGWMTVPGGKIFRTRDAGKTWKRQDSGTTRTLGDLEFVDGAYGWACGEGGIILATRDGGAHWLRQKSRTTASLWNVDFVDRLHGWAAGWGTSSQVRLRTVDGGRTWTRLKALSDSPRRPHRE